MSNQVEENNEFSGLSHDSALLSKELRKFDDKTKFVIKLFTDIDSNYEIEGDFKHRLHQVLLTAIEAANRLRVNDITQDVDFKSNTFRFITNDRLYAENNIENQSLYKEEIHKVLNDKYQDCKVAYEDISTENERLAFTIKFGDGINILDYN